MSMQLLIQRGWLRTLSISAVMLVASGVIVSNLPGQSKGGKGKKETAVEKKAAKEPKVKEGKVVNDIIVGGAGVEQVGYINEAIANAWRENKIQPSDRCTDYEFIRRASLDIIGRIATVKEIGVFLNDPPLERRSRLIERLLKSPEYATNWSNVWTTLLLTRQGVGRVYQDQMRAWLEEKLTENKESDYVPDWSKIVTEILTAKGRTNENGAVNYILAHLGEAIPRGEGGSQRPEGAYDMVPVTSRTTRLFLGLRTQCVQCHDHPFGDQWGQHHFWGINAFFRQVDAPQGRPTMMGNKMNKKGMPNQQYTLTENTSFNPKAIVPYERRSAVLLYINPTFLDGKKMKLAGDKTRRDALAKFITDSPFFAKAYVNRTWGHFFGRSFTKDAVDDFGDHNAPSHPELLERMSEDWAKKYKHNPKDLIRWICNSRAYGLSSTANKTNDKVDDEAFFARMLLKAMSPEQLFDSLMTATQAKVAETAAARQDLKQAWLNQLIANFGDDEGNETSFNGTVIQALLLMNGKEINDAIMDKDNGTVAAVLKKRAFSANLAKNAMRDLFLAALNRPPTESPKGGEYAKILNPAMYRLPRVANPQTPQAMEAFWTGFYQDMFWALLNSNEFILNH